MILLYHAVSLVNVDRRDFLVAQDVCVSQSHNNCKTAKCDQSLMKYGSSDPCVPRMPLGALTMHGGMQDTLLRYVG